MHGRFPQVCFTGAQVVYRATGAREPAPAAVATVAIAVVSASRCLIRFVIYEWNTSYFPNSNINAVSILQ
jgi:hypothetical protein